MSERIELGSGAETSTRIELASGAEMLKQIELVSEAGVSTRIELASGAEVSKRIELQLFHQLVADSAVRQTSVPLELDPQPHLILVWPHLALASIAG